LRKYFRDFTTPRRVPANTADTEAFLAEYHIGSHDRGEPLRDETGDIVAEHFLPLRVLECQHNGIYFDGILDEGSTVIVMSRRLWERLGSPMDPTLTLKMEVANGGEAMTRGVLLNIPVLIGGIVFKLQVQVVDKAPFDFLLGKPFYAIARTIISTELDGRTAVTIQDPNSEMSVTVPSKPRRQKLSSLVDFAEHPGF
jgi:hypothetical protein